MNCTKNAMLPIVLDKEAREYLADAGEITIDLPNQTVSTKDKSFDFQIDETWKKNSSMDLMILISLYSLKMQSKITKQQKHTN